MMACRLLAIACLAMAASVPVAADNDTPKLFPDDARKNPYARLFTTPRVAVPRQPTPEEVQVLQDRKPRVVCGMLVIPVGPGVDPHMRKSPPESDDTTYTIRAIEPPMCWSR